MPPVPRISVSILGVYSSVHDDHDDRHTESFSMLLLERFPTPFKALVSVVLFSFLYIVSFGCIV